MVVSTHLNKTLYRIITNEEMPYFYMFSTFISLHSRDTDGYNYNYGMTDFEFLLCTPPYNTDS